MNLEQKNTSQPQEKHHDFDWQKRLKPIKQHPIEPEERVNYMQMMRDDFVGIDQCLNSIFAHDTDCYLLNDLLELAKYLCDWPMVIFFYRQKNKVLHETNATLADPYQAIEEKVGIAESFHYQGFLDVASDSIISSLLSVFRHQKLADYYHQLQEMLRQSAFPIEMARADVISISPLEPHHLDSFYWIYSDPDIAKLCCLPRFETDEEWFEWQQTCQADPNQYLFVICHQQWGIIGSVNLTVHEGIGFFYYWLGKSFRGCGFGPQAATLLLDIGKRYFHMDCCYAKVFESNSSSHQAINKMGFRSLAFQSNSTIDREVFYYKGKLKDETSMYLELKRLFIAMQSTTQVFPSESALLFNG